MIMNIITKEMTTFSLQIIRSRLFHIVIGRQKNNLIGKFILIRIKIYHFLTQKKKKQFTPSKKKKKFYHLKFIKKML